MSHQLKSNTYKNIPTVWCLLVGVGKWQSVGLLMLVFTIPSALPTLLPCSVPLVAFIVWSAAFRGYIGSPKEICWWGWKGLEVCAIPPWEWIGAEIKCHNQYLRFNGCKLHVFIFILFSRCLPFGAVTGI